MDAKLRINKDGRIISCNQSFSDIFGYRKDEVEGRSIKVIYTSDVSFNSFWDVAYPTIKNKGSFNTEWQLMRKDGSFFPVEIYTSTSCKSEDLITNYCTIIRDITEKEKMRERIIQLEKQVMQVQKMETLGTLATGIAHDLNNILSVILGFTELSLDDVEKEKRIYKNLLGVLKAVKRAEDLVRQILTFSRQKETEQVPFQIKLVLKEAIELLKTTISANIEIKQNIISDSIVMGNPTKIQQVLMNLCINANYAMREKGGVLTVMLEDVELDSEYSNSIPNLKPGNYVVLTVGDTGQGISSGILNRVFDPFFSTKEMGEGNGMGLSIVRRIVEDHGGTITVYSQPDEGTTFKIFFPPIEMALKPEIRAQKSI